MGRIELEPVDYQIAITVEREDGASSAVSRIKAEDALMLGPLLMGEAPNLPSTSMFETVCHFWSKWPHKRPRPMISDGDGGVLI